MSNDPAPQDVVDDDPLVAAHARVHHELDECLVAVALALASGDVEAAVSAHAAFSSRLERHQRFEDEHVLPRYAALPMPPQGRLDHVEGDHTILRRLDGQAPAALEALQGANRRACVLALPLFFRLRDTLEHHTAREQRFVYPTVAASLDPADAARLTEGLTALVDAGAED
jgi:hypothetical protein